MRPAIRLAALMKLHVIYVFTHDSIALGEDGPTHQPVEQLASLRAMPNLTVIRPCDANEAVEAWKIAIAHRDGTVALILTRQKVPVIDRQKYKSASELAMGAYVIADCSSCMPEIILIASGSEVHIALAAYEKLNAEYIDVRVVSMPSWEIFERQSKEYRDAVLPPQVRKRVAIEVGSTHGWHKYVGLDGEIIGVDRFGASAPGEIVLEKFGFTTENIIAKAKGLLSKE